jgi:hypothetical protein
MGEWRYSSTHSLTSALDGDEWSASRPGRFTTREGAHGIHWIGAWGGLRAGLETLPPRIVGRYLKISHNYSWNILLNSSFTHLPVNTTRVYPKVSGLSHNEIKNNNNKHSLRRNTEGLWRQNSLDRLTK